MHVYILREGMVIFFILFCSRSYQPKKTMKTTKVGNVQTWRALTQEQHSVRKYSLVFCLFARDDHLIVHTRSFSKQQVISYDLSCTNTTLWSPRSSRCVVISYVVLVLNNKVQHLSSSSQRDLLSPRHLIYFLASEYRQRKSSFD